MIRVYFNQGNRDKLSAAGRARIAAAQRARWAKFKAKKQSRKAFVFWLAPYHCSGAGHFCFFQ
jgi:hypothetical protein